MRNLIVVVLTLLILTPQISEARGSGKGFGVHYSKDSFHNSIRGAKGQINSITPFGTRFSQSTGKFQKAFGQIKWKGSAPIKYHIVDGIVLNP